MSASIDSQLTELLERLKGVRYFYTLGHGRRKRQDPVIERVVEARRRRELLEDELKERGWTSMSQLNLESVAKAVLGIEKDTITEQSFKLGRKLNMFTPEGEVAKLGLQSEIDHASELIAHSRVPATDSVQTRNRLACLGHADQLIRSIEASLRLHISLTCVEVEFAGVRKPDGAELHFLQLRLQNIRTRTDATPNKDKKEKLDRIGYWEWRLDSIWFQCNPDEHEVRAWINTLATINGYENDFHTINQTRDAYEQERTEVMAKANEIIHNEGRDHPVYRLSNDTREEIRQLACRFLRPVASERLNRVDCAVWTKLVTIINKINDTQPQRKVAHVPAETPMSAHDPTARIPGVGVAVIDRLRRRPWEL